MHMIITTYKEIYRDGIWIDDRVVDLFAGSEVYANPDEMIVRLYCLYELTLKNKLSLSQPGTPTAAVVVVLCYCSVCDS